MAIMHIGKLSDYSAATEFVYHQSQWYVEIDTVKFPQVIHQALKCKI